METVNLANTVAKGVEPKTRLVTATPVERAEMELPELKQQSPIGQLLTREAVEKEGSNKEAIKEKVSELNSFIQNIQRGVQFSVDDDTGHSVITVTDRETGDVIRTFPSEEMLAISAQLNESLALQEEAALGLLVKAKA